MSLKGKKILLGVTGSIAAYKAAFFVRLLVKSGAEVKVVMTDAAAEFITPLTLATLSKNPVLKEFQAGEDGTWNNHVELGLWADALVIAPASANTLAKMAHGQCDNLLLACYLSARCKTYVAPAMDLDMFKHTSTTENLETLKRYGVEVIAPDSGELASGLHGQGRMAEPEAMVALLEQALGAGLPLSGKKVLVSAGPTHEPIDPVRFIGNRSSGKMGYRIAEAAAALGAEVTLVSGPSHQQVGVSGIELVKVETAAQMLEACEQAFATADITIMAAAVADFTPANKADSKIKKGDLKELSIPLESTADILKTLGGKKKSGQLLVGFALETDNEEANAQSKLERKNLDLIVLNSLRDAGAGFQHDTNKVLVLGKDNKKVNFELQSKESLARKLMDLIAKEVNT